MQVTFELSGEDLLRLQTQTLARRREWAWSSRLVFLSGGVVAGLVCWPIWRYGVAPALGPGPLHVVAYVLVVALAGAIAAGLRRVLRPPEFTGLYRWSARRLARRAAKRSTFGPVTVTIAEDALVRVNATGERRIPWTSIGAIWASPEMLTVWIRGEQRAVLVPRRAFADDAAAAAFRAAVEERAGLQGARTPDA